MFASVALAIKTAAWPSCSRTLVHDGRRRMATGLATQALQNKNPLQVDSMNNELCIVVDKDDNVIGSRSKTECHLMENINKGLLHRAFSVLLFNEKREFLLTQRSDEKITFPGFYTNACCSHPAPVPEELDKENFIGIKRAAQRRLQFELGINPEDIPVSDIHFMTRFTYVAPSEDPLWGEHELDYILVIKKELQMTPNMDELKSWSYLSQDELDRVLRRAEAGEIKLSQWFYKIARLFLPQYWADLENLDKYKDHSVIHTEKVPIGTTGIEI